MRPLRLLAAVPRPLALLCALSLVIALLSTGAAEETPEGPRWRAGDMHSHLSPPDQEGHSTFDIAGAVENARKNGLDWVIFTPHDSHVANRATGNLWQKDVAKEAGRLTREKGPLALIGWEFAVPGKGHLGISFVDIAETRLTDYRGEALADRAREVGGVVTVNHPFLISSRMWQGDRSWQPWTKEAVPDDLEFTAIEVYHTASVMIESMLGPGDPDLRMLSKSLERWDREIRTRKRRIPGVGGSDSHGKFPVPEIKPTMWVMVDRLDPKSLKEAILEGRICLGGPKAGSLSATSDVEGEKALIGGSLRARKTVHLVFEGTARVFVDGEDAGSHEKAFEHALEAPGSFHHYRIQIGGSYSNPVYANLPAVRPK